MMILQVDAKNGEGDKGCVLTKAPCVQMKNK